MDQMNILHEVLAADTAAQKRVRDARRVHAELDRETEQLRRTLGDEAVRRAQEAVERAREESLRTVQEELGALQKEHEADLAALEGRYLAGREEWTEKIFRMVVCLDDR